MNTDTPKPVVPAKAGTQVVNSSEGSEMRCYASCYELDSGLRRNDGCGF